MHCLFHKDWSDKRIKKIENIFGPNWFKGKKLLELGAGTGYIGSHFLLNRRADVTFSDGREEHLESIKTTLSEYSYNPKILNINQNYSYNTGTNYDLILHLGMLYHIENWKQDLSSALSHTNVMILETLVHPIKNDPDDYIEDLYKFEFGSIDCKKPIFTQESLENYLVSLGCKFIRFDDKNLNSHGWFFRDISDSHVYDWTYESVEADLYKRSIILTHFRRFYLILK